MNQQQDQCWLIVRPRYSVACADLRDQVTEQISFQYTIYHISSGVAQLSMDEGRACEIRSPGFAFILPGKAYKLCPAGDGGSALSIRIKREVIVEIAAEMGLDSSGGEIFF